MTLTNCILLATAMFAIGLYGLLTRRQAVALLLSIELMVNAANVALISFARYRGGPGQTVALFVLAITVAEVAVGLALVMLLYRRYDATDVDRASETRG